MKYEDQVIEDIYKELHLKKVIREIDKDGYGASVKQEFRDLIEE